MKKKALKLLACVSCTMLLAVVAVGCSGSKAVTIVVPQGADTAVAEPLRTALSGVGVKVKVVDDNTAISSGTEILLGLTNHEASARAAAGVREKDFAVGFSPKAITIQGGTDENLQKAVAYFIEHYVGAYKTNHGFPTEPAENYTEYGLYPIRYLKLDGNDIFRYVIVTPNGEATPAAALLQKIIQQAAGYQLEIVAPGQVQEDDCAIIFGSAKARQAEALSAALQDHQYLILAEDKSLYFCAGDTEQEIVGVEMFLIKHLQYSYAYNKAENARIELDGLNFRFTTAFDGSDGYDVVLSKVLSIPVTGPYNVLQGGCSDGTYAYYILEDQTLKSGNCVILKYNMSDWSLVAQSGPLPLDHGNSICYNSKTNQLAVSHTKPNKSLMSYVDPDKLTLIDKVDVGFNFYSVSYNEKLNQYIFCMSGQVAVFTDENLKILNKLTGVSLGLGSMQNYHTTEDNIFIVNCWENRIGVATYEGNVLTEIPIPISTELESLINVGDTFYTGYFNTGGDVYQTLFYKTIS